MRASNELFRLDSPDTRRIYWTRFSPGARSRWIPRCWCSPDGGGHRERPGCRPPSMRQHIQLCWKSPHIASSDLPHSFMRSCMGPKFRMFAGSLLLLLAAGPLHAQSGAIVGRVTAADGGTPVSTALVEAVVGGRTSGQATSDAVGQYRIGGLQPGTYRVIVTTVGYNVQSVENVAVPAGGSVTADVALTQTVFTLPGIAATGSRDLEKITDTPANVSVVSERDVRETPTVTPVDHLRSLPAVDIITSGVRSRNVVVRGFNNIFSGALHTLTDHRIAGVPSLRVNFLHFTPQSDEDIERMEVVLGPGSALYGPNTANGVLHIMTKSPLQDPSTVVTISGGEQDLFQGTFRTAHALSERFGFKVSGEYLRAQE